MIDRPIEKVFDFTVDHLPEWSAIVMEDHVINEVPGRIGETFRVVTEQQGNRMELEGEVLEFDRPYKSTVLMKGQLFDIYAEYQFEDLGRQTRITQRSSVSANGLMMKLMLKIMSLLSPDGGKKILDQDFATLKRLLEQRES